MPATPPTNASPQRLVSLDAYRGLVMFLMMAEMLQLPRVARHFGDDPWWQWIAFHTRHVEWTGCSLHDLIQPSFSFLVGAALPFSIASRAARGQSFPFMLAHAVWRSVLLIGLGIFLRSLDRPQTYFTFEDTLSQIGLGYTFLFLLGFRGVLFQVCVLVVILAGYWAAFALYPLPGTGFDYASVGVPPDWPHLFTGFAAHWNKNSNLAWAFDTWFLNLFPREQPFVANGGGYATLSFIPTLGTMILGLIAGGWLIREQRGSRLLFRLLFAGLICMSLGWLLDWTGVCPSVKRIWTPAWTLYSGGWCYLLLGLFYALTDLVSWRAWAFPLVVIGMNSIAIYCLVDSHLGSRFILPALKRHLGQGIFAGLGTEFEPSLSGAATLLVFWLILFWMYRRKIFLKI
jgi:heparan-alpha-glucosaminide N-acetyltransferase